jgi:hypothetical protein
MDNQHGEQTADSIGAGEIPVNSLAGLPRGEKVDFHFNDILRVFPDQIPHIIRSFESWAKQWK